jgi:hypothetical protein
MRPGRATVLAVFALAGAGCASDHLSAAAGRCIRFGEIRIVGPHGQRLLNRAADDPWFPTRALELGKNGSAILQCSVTQGKAKDCTVLAEAPAGFNFGATAVKEAAAVAAPSGSDGAGVVLFYRWSILDGICPRDQGTDHGLATVLP